MLSDFKNKRVTVMGLGLYEKGTGIEAVKFFLRQGAKVTVTDLRSAKELEGSVQELVRYYSRFPKTVIARSEATKQSHTMVKRLPRALRALAMTTKERDRDGKKSLTFILGKHREEDFKNADVVFQNPSVPSNSPYLRIAEKRKIPIVNDWSIFLSRHTPKLFVGVTGTRGKSTTTALIYEMLKKGFPHPISPSPNPSHRGRGTSDRFLPLDGGGKVGVRGKVWLAGNLCVSPLAFIDAYRGEPIVAELSSWLLHHFAGPKKSPNVAVVTNIMSDHMDKYRSMREYIADKENIFRFQTRRQGLRSSGGLASEYVVLNYDNSITRDMAKRARGKVLWFSAEKRLPRWVPLEELQFPGEHNHANALAAAAAAEAAGVPRPHILHVLKTFHGLPGRLELVRTVDGVKYYNDTTATTPEATIVALKTLNNVIASAAKQSRDRHGLRPRDDRRVVLICGGADKKLDYREMVKYVAKYCKAVVMLKGTATEKMKHALQGQSLFARTVLEAAQSMRDAVKKARALAQDGDVVLLSPAAASFGLFKNEFDRGKQFVDAVKKL